MIIHILRFEFCLGLCSSFSLRFVGFVPPFSFTVYGFHYIGGCKEIRIEKSLLKDLLTVNPVVLGKL